MFSCNHPDETFFEIRHYVFYRHATKYNEQAELSRRNNSSGVTQQRKATEFNCERQKWQR